jgi:serine/threonine-protein kinase
VADRKETTGTERFLPGVLFAGRYRIVHRLGKGGAGEVYRAEDIRLDQTIALKLLSPSSSSDAWTLEQFRDEARLARRVSHSAVCRIYDFGEAEGLTYVAMEHIEGEDLASLRRRIGRLPPERALEVSLEICRGLGAIHELGILHRDLKPANVMLDGQGRARILDFGLAALTGTVSGPDVRSGTPAYMAPEQADGRGVTFRSDLYSLGLVLWELWTGERLGKEDRRSPPWISSRVEGVDPAVDRVVARCLELDPERRPASAASVAASLRQAGTIVHGPALRTVVAFDSASPLGAGTEAIADLLESFGGQEVWDAKGRLWLFERPWDGVSCAVAYRALAENDEIPEGARLAVDVTEVVLRARRPGEPGSAAVALRGDGAAPLARALAALARPGQTLLSGDACRLARRSGRVIEGGEELSWLSHGRYRMPGGDEPIEVFEVGVEGRAPLAAPMSTEASPLVPDVAMVTGWRPAPGTSIPKHPNFQIERRLGEGGYGEAWLARHRKTGERRVFKFCFDAARLRGLRREITLFRLLKEELGDRDDIARVLDWNLEEAPFFIQSEYTAGGDLTEWAEDQGGAGKVPLDRRLELVAQIADALAAAHSVGVLHKDVKPSNILITTDPEGGFKARLADFGVGRVTDKERLVAAGITRAGWTTLDSEESGDSASGTRLYQAPEVLEGRPATLQAEIYALGVVLYQLVVGHLGRAVAPGWRDAIDDPLLIEDITTALHGEPASRFQSAQELAQRLRSLEARRTEARQAALRRQEEEERQRLLERATRRRRFYRFALTLGLMLVAVMATLTAWALYERRKEAEARRESERMTDFLVDLFDIADPYSSWATDVVVPELSVRELLEGGVGRLESAFQDEPRIQARLLDKLGGVFQSWGEYERARSLRQRGLEIRRELFGPDHLEVAKSLDALGYLGSLSAPQESEKQLREALEIRRRHLSADHLDIAQSLHNLAVNLSIQGSHTEAEVLARKALVMRQGPLGQDHPDIAMSLISLASILEDQDRYAEAELLLREALAMQRRLMGVEHPDIATSLKSLAVLRQKQGSYDDAETLFRQALAMRQHLLGREHPSVGVALNDLAMLLQLQSSYAEAESLFREALAIFRRLGEDHHNVAACLQNLAEVLREQGSFAEAVSLSRESLEMRRRLYGDEHIEVVKGLSSLANSLDHQGFFAEAESSFREALKIGRRLLGNEHTGVATMLNNLGHVLRARGSYAEAESCLREALEMRRRLLGARHDGVAGILVGLARVLIDLGQLEEGEERIREALAIYGEALAPGHWRIAYAESVEAAVWTAQSRFVEAEAVLLASHANVAAAKGSKSRSTCEILERLVDLYEAWDEPKKAEESHLLRIECRGSGDFGGFR